MKHIQPTTTNHHQPSLTITNHPHPTNISTSTSQPQPAASLAPVRQLVAPGSGDPSHAGEVRHAMVSHGKGATNGEPPTGPNFNQVAVQPTEGSSRLELVRTDQQMTQENGKWIGKFRLCDLPTWRIGLRYQTATEESTVSKRNHQPSPFSDKATTSCQFIKKQLWISTTMTHKLIEYPQSSIFGNAGHRLNLPPLQRTKR